MEHTGDTAGARGHLGVRCSVRQPTARRLSIRLRRRKLVTGSSPTRPSFLFYNTTRYAARFLYESRGF